MQTILQRTYWPIINGEKKKYTLHYTKFTDSGQDTHSRHIFQLATLHKPPILGSVCNINYKNQCRPIFKAFFSSSYKWSLGANNLKEFTEMSQGPPNHESVTVGNIAMYSIIMEKKWTLPVSVYKCVSFFTLLEKSISWFIDRKR